ncbi:LAQU0S10e02850g1_1 [Lachancea quebecensis]|uniref:LAQU0S10e02850g1_1 n=1 Tax=Lachancea quebecensis TaxID=1654605 RepID=A0A0P1KUD4_9SACH|nr:LAQU0S10e02850g1_1 [Lachancea quebecensis]
MAARHVSASSTISSGSTSNLLVSGDPAPSMTQPELDAILHYTLKVILIEYINEPRFKARIAKPKGPVRTNIKSTKEKKNKRSSWLFPDDGARKDQAEAKQLQKLTPTLENYLRMVAMDKVKVKQMQLRRSLLKLYNDAFLDPHAPKNLLSLTRLEELVMLFTKAANGELAKVGSTSKTKEELYSQVCCFLDTITQLATQQESSKSRLVTRIHEYKKQFSNPKSMEPLLSSLPSNGSNTELSESAVKPTFKLADVAHSAYLMELFNLSEIEFQQILIKNVNETSNAFFGRSMQALKAKLVSQDNTELAYTFPVTANFEKWKKGELQELDVLITKFSRHGAYEHDSSNYMQCIPEKARAVYTGLARLILERELHADPATSVLPKDAVFLLTKCAYYWRVDLPSTKATLLYTAANAGSLSGETVAPEKLEMLFKIILTKALTVEGGLDSLPTWRVIDQQEWMSNLTITFEQCMNSMKLCLSAIYQKPMPKFSPILSIYYTYIEAGFELLGHEISETTLYKKHLRRLRRVLFRTSEQYYVSLVKSLPRDGSMEIHNVKEIADQILENLQNIQKKYKNPLLDQINLASECAKVLIEAFGVDCSAMLAQVERFSKAGNQSKIPLYDATETYKTLRELRDVYAQVQSSKKFPFKLEKHFLKYLSELCDDCCLSTLTVVKTALEKEDWEPADLSETYSTSVIDIFKMIHESFDLFLKLGWGDQYQISKICTFLLKSVADGLSYYANTVASLVESEMNISQCEEGELTESESERKVLDMISQTAAAKMKSTWLYSEMRSALKSSDVVIPKPYEFQSKTCTCLNNLNQMIKMISDLEERINPEEVSSVVNQHERLDAKRRMMTDKQNKGLRHLYTVKVIRAENVQVTSHSAGLLSTVSIVDTKNKREVAKTREVLKASRPVWNEEFEIEIPVNDTRPFSFILWHHKPKSDSTSSRMSGRSFLYLDPHKFKNDGYPQDVCLNLDTHGRIFLQISVETERVDALFAMGRAYRSLSRARDRSIELMVSKFQVFVHFAFSRTTLKTICGANGQSRPSNTEIYDSIVPLFDYLNANLNILASHLSRELLHKIMLEAWEEILNEADALLLPFLSDAPRAYQRSMKNKSIWENAVDVAKLGMNTSLGSERPLTQIEIDTVFEWLRALCIDFFHNNGEGPPLTDLKNMHYQALLLIPVFYDKNVSELKSEADALNRDYRKSMFGVNHHEGDGPRRANSNLRRANTLARKRTIIANSSRKRRLEVDKEIKASEENPAENIVSTQDVILRILIAKGEAEFVLESLSLRERVSKALRTEQIVKAAKKSY